MSLMTSIIAIDRVVQVGIAGVHKDSEAGAGAVSVAKLQMLARVPTVRLGKSTQRYVRKETANGALVRASRANMAIIGGRKPGAGACDAEAQNLARVLPVGAGADVNLDGENSELHGL